MADIMDLARLWADHDALHVHGVAVSLLTEGPRPQVEHDTDGAVIHLRAGRAGATLLRLDVPLGDAVGYWHPAAGWDRHLVADWASRWRPVGLVDSAPLGCLYDAAGAALLAFSSDRVAATTRMRFGVAEPSARFGVWLAMDLLPGEHCRIRVQAPGRPFADAVRTLTRRLSAGDELPLPDAARTPAYSSWYSLHRDVDAARVEAEAALAAEAGCGVLLLDDGWQRHADGAGYSGSGDWSPDPAKFPDFAEHVRTVQGLGLRYLAWIAPLLLGERTEAYQAMKDFAPHAVPRLSCRVLDPRHAEARRFVVESCVDLVRRYGLDGLKIDFLDFAMVYADEKVSADEMVHADEEGGRPGRDIGLAMRGLLTELRDRLRELRGDELLIEFRQPYTGPGMLSFGNLLRAGDCPADATGNRVRTLDIRAAATAGSVHSDMLMWDPGGSVRAAARQLHSALYATPQISVRLAEQSAEHRAMTNFWLGFWRDHRDVLTRGEIRAGRPDELYGTVVASSARRAVITFYAEQRLAALDLEGFTEVALVNSTAVDHVTLDIGGRAVEVRLDTSDACGRPAGSSVRTLAPGPHTIPVPPSGLCVLRPEPPTHSSR
ncbi:glycoside hydrolase family 36 protein [Streptomyces scopuliridis]|uniref:glycoside hydrolase family 36 protein n=1 Tax=Streptomyces scopuliridis TaxID=452529 RepID=UPI0034221D89